MRKFDYRVSVTREFLVGALVRLLKNYELKDISICTLCMDAGVSRATFYNNHTSKEEVLLSYISDWYYKTFKDILYNNNDEDPIFTFFDACHEQLPVFNAIMKCKLDQAAMNELMECVEYFINESSNSEHFQINQVFMKNYPYSLYGFIGKTYMTIVYWLKNETLTPREITDLFLNTKLSLL